MPNPTWPATLPQYADQSGFKEQAGQSTIRTPMEHGVVKQRRRYTAVPVKYSITLMMTDAQKATLDTFFRDTCKSGSLAFDWVLPVEQSAATFIFTSEPSYSPVGPFTFSATFEMQTVP